MTKQILCIGEILWDALPAGLFLGGAPFNVACHLHNLGEDVVMISRVGNDELGRQIFRRVKNKGMISEGIQTDYSHLTGVVNVELDENGVPAYEIVQPSAWDFIELDKSVEAKAKSANVFIFGSLAQRSEKSRNTIKTLLGYGMLNVFDINLRPPYIDKHIIEYALQKSHILKLNDAELIHLRDWFNLPNEMEPAVKALAEKFDCETICVTKGEKGAGLWRQNEWTEHPGYKIEPKDTVGAGDAFLAALVISILAGKDNESTLAFANDVGAYVATKDGATPKIDLQNDKPLMKRLSASGLKG